MMNFVLILPCDFYPVTIPYLDACSYIRANLHKHDIFLKASLLDNSTHSKNIIYYEMQKPPYYFPTRTVKAITNCEVTESVVKFITSELDQTFKDRNWREDLKFAVRSSAIGEDSEELSAAGQNETFLGCRGQERILEALRQCWASLYAYQSVEYRRYIFRKM